MRTGFTGVHANEDVGGAVFALESNAESAAGGEESGVVKRRSAGDAADTVGTEKIFGHEKGVEYGWRPGESLAQRKKGDTARRRGVFADGNGKQMNGG